MCIIMASEKEVKTKEIYTECESRDHFLSFLGENTGIMLFKFGATWCRPCNYIKDDVEKYFGETPDNVICFDLDIDDCFDLYAFLKSKKMVTGVPSILAYKKGNSSFASDFSYSGSDKTVLQQFFQTINVAAKNI